jgi:membrane-bound lytic murein transglycosylase B
LDTLQAPARERASGESFFTRLTLLTSFSLIFLVVFQFGSGAQRYATIPSSFPHLFGDLEVVKSQPASDGGDLGKELSMSPRALMARWAPYIAEASRRFGVPEAWIQAVVRAESGGRTLDDQGEPITSKAGAMGVMQVMPQTYDEMRADYRLGADPYNPHDNIIAGTAYLSWLRRKYGYPNMFAAYNDGPGNFDKHLSNGRALPAETVAYIAGITRHLEHGGARSRRATRLARS